MANAGHGIPESTYAEASALRGWHQDFLVREPYVRPVEHKVPK